MKNSIIQKFKKNTNIIIEDFNKLYKLNERSFPITPLSFYFSSINENEFLNEQEIIFLINNTELDKTNIHNYYSSFFSILNTNKHKDFLLNLNEELIWNIIKKIDLNKIDGHQTLATIIFNSYNLNSSDIYSLKFNNDMINFVIYNTNLEIADDYSQNNLGASYFSNNILFCDLQLLKKEQIHYLVTNTELNKVYKYESVLEIFESTFGSDICASSFLTNISDDRLLLNYLIENIDFSINNNIVNFLSQNIPFEYKIKVFKQNFLCEEDLKLLNDKITNPQCSNDFILKTDYNKILDVLSSEKIKTHLKKILTIKNQNNIIKNKI